MFVTLQIVIWWSVCNVGALLTVSFFVKLICFKIIICLCGKHHSDLHPDHTLTENQTFLC